MERLAAQGVKFDGWLVQAESICSPLGRAVGMDGLGQPILGVVDVRRDQGFNTTRCRAPSRLIRLTAIAVVTEPGLAEHATLRVDDNSVSHVPERVVPV